MGNIISGKISEALTAFARYLWPSRSQSHAPTLNEKDDMEDPVESNPPQPTSSTEDQVIMIFTEQPPRRAEPEKKPVISVGLQMDSILAAKTGHLKERYNLGDELGRGHYGRTFHCVDRSTRESFACKSIAKRRLLTEEDVREVRREVEIMHHLSGKHPNIISISGAYEDSVAVHVVMELCKGGELFDRISDGGHYSEAKAAGLTRTIVGVIERCHSLGVMHRDLKPENFLFVGEDEDSELKLIDFGLSVFFKPGEIFRDVVGSPYYLAPEVLRACYGPEADVWSAGVIVYILLCGQLPFWGESDQEVFQGVLHGEIDFTSDPWPNISESAKDLVKKMLLRNPTKRLTAQQVLRHPWVQKPLDHTAVSSLFSSLDKSLSEEEVAGLQAMFEAVDTDKSGYIGLEELKAGLKRFEANLNSSEIHDADADGRIDYKEFVGMMMMQKQNT